MSKPKKWAANIEPTSPVTLVARDSIEYRLNSVWRYASLAAKKADKDVEHVHQLRVSVRRANAVIELYTPFLMRKKVRKLRKQLRAFRHAAGPARDLDVLAERLARMDAGSFEKGLKNLRKVVAAHRARAQPPMKRIYKQAKRKAFVDDIKKFVKSVKWRSEGQEPDFGTFAITTFEPIIDRFFTAGQANLRATNALHQMRIEGKTVRYAMELLSPAFGESFRKDLYPVFTKVQDKLGEINDHASAIDFYRHLLKSADVKNCTAFIVQMIELEIAELESSRLAFVDWWSPERSSEMRRQFNAVLMSAQNQSKEVTNMECVPRLESTPHLSTG